MRRYFIVLGDKTTAGGVVIQGDESCRNHGKPMAYHGAQIYCHACKSTGYICNMPPYRPMKLMGKQVALENDICICKCKPPPRLIASQNNASMSFEAHELGKSGNAAVATPAQGTHRTGGSLGYKFNDKFILRERDGAPLTNSAYAIERETGEFEYGETDGDGHTHLLSAVAAAERINIYVAG